MIQTQVKSFEFNLTQNPNARQKLEQEIHQFIAFFKENVLDYDISICCYNDNDEIKIIGIVSLRHRKVDGQQSW